MRVIFEELKIKLGCPRCHTLHPTSRIVENGKFMIVVDCPDCGPFYELDEDDWYNEQHGHYIYDSENDVWVQHS